MSNLKKIYDIEVTPPPGAWNAIAIELDNINQNKSLSNRVHSIEIPPPAMSWDNIARELTIQDQEKTLSQKIYNVETPAPAMAWDLIEKQLDDQQALDIIEKKLSNIQVSPPRAAWANIIRQLDGRKKEPAIVAPMNHGWLKYAAAACFVAIVSISAFFILSDHNSGPDNYTAAGSKPASTSNVKTALVNNTPKPGSGTAQQQALKGIRTRLGNAYSPSNERNAELQNRYIILMTQDGNIVRMSKKVSNMADCIAGEDHSCDDQISKWQKEMASSSAASSPDNFLDILDMASADAGEAGSLPNM